MAVVVEIDPKHKEALDMLADGNLGSAIKNNAKYTLTGMVVGAVIGALSARLIGKSQLLFGLAGAVIAGSAGFLISDSTKK